MRKSITETAKPSRATYEVLEEMVRLKVQEYIQDILEEEVETFLGRKKSERLTMVDGTPGYWSGHGKPKKFSVMNGTITVRRPRVRGSEDRFESKIIPFFKRRSKEVGQLLPELYLHGLAKGDFELALRGLLGDGAPLSASSIDRLKAKWQREYAEWKQLDMSRLEVVYQWADGIYVKAGLEKDKAALLVIIGGLTNGKKVFLACESGYRESKESWSGVLRNLTARGLKLGRLTIADGHLGIWSALGELHPEGKEQRCWNHKIRNVLNCFPKRIRSEAGEYLKRIPYAETLSECERLRDAFVDRYRKDYPKAAEKLLSDWDRMITFYSFPKEHWVHIRTTNVVESPFSSVRLRTDAAKRFKKVQNATAMIWKLLQVAEKNFRTLKGYWLLSDVYTGKRFVDGVMKHETNVLERMAA
ncbi:MAG: IS256 family transposase [Thermodesulfovibrionales bacterium]|nr:IS256 family transposase [Thermodesulfovibrionales bacterium]